MSFVDPKGIRNLEGLGDAKIRFHQEIKKLEQRLGDPQVTLNSFVVSVTPYNQVGWWDGGMTEQEFVDHHILFRDAEHLAHIRTIFQKLVTS